MPAPQPTESVTELLVAWSDGDLTALDRLIPLVEGELRRLARRQMRRESPAHTLQTTALVNEVYLKLVDQTRARWQSRAHFFAVAAEMMRRILVDYARRHLRGKRGGGTPDLTLEEAAVLSREKSVELLALNEALGRLAEIDPLKVKIIELRHFGGLSVKETAEVLKVSEITVLSWHIRVLGALFVAKVLPPGRAWSH